MENAMLNFIRLVSISVQTIFVLKYIRKTFGAYFKLGQGNPIIMVELCKILYMKTSHEIS
jgi:hypothetical protein